MKGKTRSRVHHLTRSLKKIGKGLGRKNHASITFQAMQHKRVRERILKVMAKDIRKEMTAMCSIMTPSILRDTTPTALQSFKWEALVQEMKVRAPTLLAILSSCVQKKPPKLGQKTCCVKNEAVIGVCAAVLLRRRNHSLNLLQRVVSMILYSNHAGKQVHTYMYVCVIFMNRI